MEITGAVSQGEDCHIGKIKYLISPTCTLAFRKTSGTGYVVDTFGLVEFVA